MAHGQDIAGPWLFQTDRSLRQQVRLASKNDLETGLPHSHSMKWVLGWKSDIISQLGPWINGHDLWIPYIARTPWVWHVCTSTDTLIFYKENCDILYYSANKTIMSQVDFLFNINRSHCLASLDFHEKNITCIYRSLDFISCISHWVN